jgi:hypothetical protein
MSQFAFRAAVLLIVAVTFTLLASRSRPMARFGGLEPLLHTAGLHQPHGLLFQEDGSLLVAEAGGLDSTGARVPGRVSLIAPAGQIIASASDTADYLSGDDIWSNSGPTALAGATSGAGNGGTGPLVFAGPAHPASDARLLAAERAGTELRLQLLATLQVGGTPWSAVTSRDGSVYLTVPLANRVLRLRPATSPTGAPDMSALTGFLGTNGDNPLPSGVTVGPEGALYATLFATEPGRPGSGKVVRIEADGRWQPIYEDLTFPVALVFSPSGQLYVLEFSRTYDQRTRQFLPDSGRLLAVGPAPYRRRVVLRDISLPTAVTFSPIGDIYLTENGAQSRAGSGHILRIPAQSLQLFG